MNPATTTEFSAEVQQKIVEAFQWGASIDAAAIAAGVTPQDVHRWMSQGATEDDGPFRAFLSECDRALGTPDLSTPPSVELAKVALTDWRALVNHLVNQVSKRKRRKQ
jgi:hypothetical protein